MLQLHPYLNFDGDCAEAFKLYQQVLGGEIEAMMTFAEAPGEEMPPELGSLILHACIKLGDQLLMASDAPPGKYQPPAGNYVTIALDSTDEAQRIYDALSPGGSIEMPLEKTFWAERFAMFKDRYGTPWMINCGPLT